MIFHRDLLKTLLSRLAGPRRHIQVLSGPRQVGKTTLAREVMEALGRPAHYASADEPSLRDRRWVCRSSPAGASDNADRARNCSC